MEREPKMRRPRIGDSKSAGRDGISERYEKVDYSQNPQTGGYDAAKRPRINYNNGRDGNNRPSYGNNRNGGYSRTGNNYGDNRNYNRPVNRPRQYNNGDEGGNNQRPYNNRPSYGNNNGGYGNNRYGNNNGGQRRPYGNGNNAGNNRMGNRPANRMQHRDNDYNSGMKFNPRKRVVYSESNIDPNEPVRLNKYLANAGVCSRREADEYIQAGEITVNGTVITELGTKIQRSDEVKFKGEIVKPEGKIYVLLNKPKDCVTTVDDPQGRLTVMDIVRSACSERIYPVGRLDRNTTGVLLLTNDGDLASKLTHPKFIKKKIYHVWLDRDINEDDMQRIADGVELEDGLIQPDAVSYATDTDKNQVGIEIHSGRNRIVRRIFEALGYHVTKLDRVYFAGLTKKNLPRGRWRYLTQEEVNMLNMGAFE
ncbi:MAG: rRNA pseudouridine synthase [Bacteroidaceae bacterium]|nr:rRNA pseudouridine synthase [Bacteroidaceae bacterium]